MPLNLIFGETTMSAVIRLTGFSFLIAVYSINFAFASELLSRRVIVGSDVVNARIPAGFELELLTTKLGGRALETLR